LDTALSLGPMPSQVFDTDPACFGTAGCKISAIADASNIKYTGGQVGDTNCIDCNRRQRRFDSSLSR
jgi:hypothetical protein